MSLAMGLVSLQTDRRRTSSSPKKANETPATLVEVTSGEGAAIVLWECQRKEEAKSYSSSTSAASLG